MKYLLPVCMLFASCGSTSAPESKVELPAYPIASNKAVFLLESYYAGNLPAGPEAFFRQWHAAMQPKTDLGSETEKAVYAIFAQVFRPQRVKDLGDWEPEAQGFARGIPYVILPEKIAFTIDGKPDTIQDFRPAVPESTGKSLYLHAAYDSVLHRFLNTRSGKRANYNIGEGQERGNWLRNWVPVIANHNDGWYVVSHPLINRISFDKSLQRATVNFRMGYQFGEAVVVRKGEQWELESSQATGIE